jgi:ribosomal protein S18 acetylase RimI-like enzyme
MLVRALVDDDRSWAREELIRVWGATAVARLGELVDAADRPGFVAVVNDQRAGLLTYVQRGDEIEGLTLHVARQGAGVGQALMDALWVEAQEIGVSRVWLLTTNDNVRAIAFYQRWGMDLVTRVHDGVSASRLVKPRIPLVGGDGILVRHELVFERRSVAADERRS